MHPSLQFVRARAPDPLAAPGVHVPDRGTRLFASGDGLPDAAGHEAVAWLVLRGRLEVRAREGVFVLGSREWIALDADSAPRAAASADALVLGVGIGVGIDVRGPLPRAAEAFRRTLFPGRGRIPHGLRARALRLWHAHGAFAPGAHAAGAPAAIAEVQGFLAALQADVVHGAARCPGHSESRKRQVLLRMQRARMYLEGSAGAGVRIAELARRANFSPWYFSKVFHAVYGIGPLQFAAHARLELASRLLATTRLPVTEVSAACGFDNPCSFARAFRARYGMTASEHRLRNAAGAGAVRARHAGVRGALAGAVR